MDIPGVLELLFLILDAAVDLRAHAGDLQLSAHDLSLLLLKGGLSLLKGSLELFFLQLKTPAGLVQLVDVAASLTQLVGQVVDLVWGSRRGGYVKVKYVSVSFR